jgi:two-component system OmpR family response regulator
VSKIMIVDDEEKIRHMVKKMLEGEGYGVLEADSGAKCLEILKDEKPDLILMDIVMPLMDGWETVEEIHKDESNKDIIISMLTVKSTAEDRAKSLGDVNADWHIRKPITEKRLLETVDWLLKTQ